jgi:hypothetical protein
MQDVQDTDLDSVPSELDISWANPDHEEDIIDMEPMTEIACVVLYIDSDGNLRHVYREKHPLEKKEELDGDTVGSRFSREALLRYIHTKKTHQGLKYRLGDILLYHVDIGADRLMPGLSAGGELGKLATVTLQDEIVVGASLCIFHEINSLYFLFQEPPKYDDDDAPVLPKPALKMTPMGPAEGQAALFPRSHRRKKTKKVTFQDMAYRYTRKRGPDLGAGAPALPEKTA